MDIWTGRREDLVREKVEEMRGNDADGYAVKQQKPGWFLKVKRVVIG